MAVENLPIFESFKLTNTFSFNDPQKRDSERPIAQRVVAKQSPRREAFTARAVHITRARLSSLPAAQHKSIADLHTDRSRLSAHLAIATHSRGEISLTNSHVGQYSAPELHVIARRGWAPEWVEGGHRCGWQDLLLPRGEWGDELGASDGGRKRRFGQVHGGARR